MEGKVAVMSGLPEAFMSRTFGSWVRIPLRQCMHVCPPPLSMFVLSRISRGLAMGGSPPRGLYRTPERFILSEVILNWDRAERLIYEN
jgi:hypothetical protein